MSDLLIKSPMIYEPKKSNRFILRFPSDLGIQEWTVSKAARPNIEQQSKEIQFMNTSTYVLGRYTWNTIDVTLRDMIGPSTTQAVMEWVRLHSESATGRQGYACGYKRNLELEMLDPTGAVIEKWVIVNAFITKTNMGDLDYSNDDVITCQLTLQYDYAILAY